MFRRWTLLAGGAILLAALPVQAQDSLVGQLYGRGTHAYFSGDFVKAHGLLTAAIDGETGDPRAYYFRGLVYLRLGRPEEARMDFRKGARLEATDSNTFYDVSKALERVQGRARLVIERYRAEARLAAMKRAKAIHHARYEAIRGEEARVVVKNVVLTPEPIVAEESAVVETAPRAQGKEPVAAAHVEKDPFAKTPPAASSTGAPKKSGKLLGAFGKALGGVIGKRVQGITGPLGKGSPGGTMRSPGITQPAPTGGSPFDSRSFDTVPAPKAKAAPKPANDRAEDDPFDDEPLGDVPAMPPPKKAPAKTGQGGAQGDPFHATPTREAKTPAGGGVDSGTQDDPFKGVHAPAVPAPAKATGQVPWTRPSSSAGPYRGAPPELEGSPKLARPTQKRAKKNSPTSPQPADGSPFVNEPLPAPVKILPAKETK